MACIWFRQFLNPFSHLLLLYAAVATTVAVESSTVLTTSAMLMYSLCSESIVAVCRVML